MTEINTELKNIVEAALLVAGQPLTIDKLASLFPEEGRPSRDELRAILKVLQTECEGRGVELKQLENAYRYQTHEKYAEWIARLYEERPQRYSRALLETLAIIAYRQPVTRGEIEDIRGVAVSTEIIKTLLGREWVRQVGQRDVPGRPALYGTTRGFLEHFNLKSLDELPPLSELRDFDKISAELNMRLPVDEDSATADADEDATSDEDALHVQNSESDSTLDDQDEALQEPSTTSDDDMAESEAPGAAAAKL